MREKLQEAKPAEAKPAEAKSAAAKPCPYKAKSQDVQERTFSPNEYTRSL
jgi:hypothetical protein